jgi:subtilisin family serine protease
MRSFCRFFSISIAIIVLLSPPDINAGQYSSAWQRYLESHSQDRMLKGIISMTDQVDLRGIQAHLYAIHADRRLWHETVVKTLQEKAMITQTEILAELAKLKSQGRVESYHGLWIGNIVTVTAAPDVFDLLKDRFDVGQISPDYRIDPIVPVRTRPDSGLTISRVENGLRAIGADSCWAMGITGAGRLISSLDTGVDGTHPALADRWRGVADPRYAGHPEWAWRDPVYNSDFPADSGWIGHGTITMGVTCGLEAETGDTIGVAFGAQWISAVITGHYDTWEQIASRALAALQWTADPDGDPATVWDVPDVNNGSWGFSPDWLPDTCDEMFWVAIDGCEAAGVAVIFSAGNEGPTAESIRNPANRATTGTTCFSVGAVNAHAPGFPIADFSSRGPAYCTPDGSPAIKPEVSAPGVDIRSSIPGGYLNGDGTSEAAPHVAGVVALMRQANPNLTTEEVYQILMETAVDKGTPGDDNNYGAGVINAYHAVLRAMAYGQGLFSGVITNCISGQPIEGALVTAINHDPPLSAYSGPDGRFNLLLPAHTIFSITIEKPTFYRPAYDSIMVVPLDTIYQNYALHPICQYMIGDINGNGQVDGSDIVYAVSYFKGGQIPPVDCHLACPDEPNPFYAACDVNGNCRFNGIDLVFFVGYLKGLSPALRYCPDCPPAGR